MIKACHVILIGVVVLGASTAGAQHTCQFNPCDDAYVDSASPNANFGSAMNLYVGDRTAAGGGTALSFVQFDLSPLGSGCEILSAELWLYKHEKYGSIQTQTTVGVHHVTTPGWNELAITWNAPPGYATAPTASFTDFFNPPGWVHYDVTVDVVGDYPAQTCVGWCLKQSPLPWVWLNFWSSEQNPLPDYRPLLEITYNGPVPARTASWGEVKALHSGQ
jgi:hypothetical protein